MREKEKDIWKYLEGGPIMGKFGYVGHKPKPRKLYPQKKKSVPKDER